MSKGPLIVRLCNWVGEAVLSLPTLTMLSNEGYELHLIGKRWAISLFEGHGWPVHVRPAKRADAIQQLKALRSQLSQAHTGFSKRPNMVLFTNSFSSALEARLAGLKPIGYRREGRGLVLAHGVPYTAGLHAADNYWRVGSHFAGVQQARPIALGLQPSPQQEQRARELLRQHQVASPFVILCPFSGAADTTGKKLWPAFPDLAHKLHEQGLQVILCPGPGEEGEARQNYPQAITLTGVDLGAYAALAQLAECTVSNDTGPGHLAAAVGGRLVSVLGPDAADMWLPQGEHVQLMRPPMAWPTLPDVMQAVKQANAQRAPQA